MLVSYHGLSVGIRGGGVRSTRGIDLVYGVAEAILDRILLRSYGVSLTVSVYKVRELGADLVVRTRSELDMLRLIRLTDRYYIRILYIRTSINSIVQRERGVGGRADSVSAGLRYIPRCSCSH